MAKSIRSKRGRMLRAIKRERYGKKELIKLKKMLGLEIENKDVEMQEDNVIEFTLAKRACDIAEDKKRQFKEAVEEVRNREPLESDNSFNAKLPNEFGTYPIWMNQRKVQSVAIKNRKYKKRLDKRLRRQMKKK